MSQGGAEAPLILTALLDAASQARFEAERQRLFPPERNQVPAHVTLFHHLPGGAEVVAIRDRLGQISADQAPCPFATTGLRFLGFGSAYGLEMPAIAMLRRQLACHWADWLTPQDRRDWQPHLTVQNKAAPEEAKRAYAGLLAGFQVERGLVTGLALWRYLRGPWDLLASYPFAETDP